MNTELFNNAQVQYRSGNFQLAYSLFTQCLNDASAPFMPGEVGLINHQIGNCLIKMKSAKEAIAAYDRALADTAYEASGSVNYNQGMAYAAICDYNSAIRHFDAAIASGNYPTPHKAQMGKGNALMKLGKVSEAGVAFREAALDQSNPEPSKALLSLGNCFMELNRPGDAAQSYESALQLGASGNVVAALQSALGQAYAALGRNAEAVVAFENAINAGLILSAPAQADYMRCKGATAQMHDVTQVMAAAPAPMAVQQSYTGQFASPYASASFPAQPQAAQPMQTAPAQAVAPQFDQNYYGAQDNNIENWSRGVAKEERKKKYTGLKIIIIILALLLALVGTAVVLYSQGYGYPSQETVITKLFANVDNNDSDEEIWMSGNKGVSSVEIAKYKTLMIQDENVQIDGINKTMGSTEAYVTATNAQQGSLTYRVILNRDGIGWKVISVELYVYSQN
ncbi:MAG: tetratricopeptide repeat protein [Eggerthellaceae bacterium]|nr:tetratricopeptide repeat protein [Eggerthellaceae bacterium]